MSAEGVFVIFFCTALIGHPQMNSCEPTHFPSYQTLGECKAHAAKIPIAADSPPHAVYLCMQQP
jgi:hypothetical protein